MSSFPSGSIMPPGQQISVNINGTVLNLWDTDFKGTFAQYKSTSQKGVWTVYCDWANVITYPQAILGGSTNLGGTTIYINGWQCPYNNQWFAQTVDFEGVGFKAPIAGFPILGYQYAKLTVTFGIPDFSFGNPLDIGDDELDFSVETYNLPSNVSVLQYNDGKPVPNGQVRSVDIPIIGYNRVRYNMANLPINTVRACINHVNSTPIFGGATGTVRFVGGKSRRKITAAGAANWDVTFSFSENVKGWNNLYEAGVGWTAVTYTAGGSIYDSTDLNNLFLASAS